MTTAFTPDTARALGGPDWLVERRLRAAERLAGEGRGEREEPVLRGLGVERVWAGDA